MIWKIHPRKQGSLERICTFTWHWRNMGYSAEKRVTARVFRTRRNPHKRFEIARPSGENGCPSKLQQCP
jgi:hypothetical protein